MSKYRDNIHLEDQNNTTTQIYNSIKENSLVLDVGCASGYFAELLVEDKNCTVIGIEIDKVDAKKAEKHCKLVLTDDIESKDWEAKLKDYKFDHIVFADVLGHLKDPESTLRRMRKVLKPDGTILVSVPNIAHISIRLELLKGDFVPEKVGILDNTHLKYFTKATFLDIARKAGFKSKKIASYSFDFPESWLIDFFDKLGLKTSPQAVKNFSTPEAVTYQYFFELVRQEGNEKIVKHEEKPVYNVRKFLKSVEIDHQKFKDAYAKELGKLGQENANLKEHIKNLESNLAARKLRGIKKNLKDWIRRLSR